MERIVVKLPFIEFLPEHTCDGEDSSPEIRVGETRASTLAVVAINPTEPGCSFCAWLVWNLPPVRVIPAGIRREPEISGPVPGLQGTNDHGYIGYSGPCPPPGGMHRVSFKVYGLDISLSLPPGATLPELIGAMKGHVVGFGTTEAIYHR